MKKWSQAAKLVFGLLMLGFILGKVDLHQTVAALASARPSCLAAAAAFLLLGIVLQVLRWQLVLHACAVRSPFWLLMRIQFVGLFFNSFLLGSVGGDLIKTIYLGRAKDYPRLLSATLFTRVLGGLATFIVAWAALWGAPQQFRVLPWWPACVITLTVAALASVAGLLLPMERPFLAVVGRILPDKWNRRVVDVAEPLQAWRRKPRLAALSMLLAVAFQVVGFIPVVYYSAHALDIAMPMTTIALITAIVAIALALPISVNGIGVTEGTYVYLCTACGVSTEKALSLALLCRFWMIVLALMGGLVYMGVRRSPPPPEPENAGPPA